MNVICHRTDGWQCSVFW